MRKWAAVIFEAVFLIIFAVLFYFRNGSFEAAIPGLGNTKTVSITETTVQSSEKKLPEIEFTETTDFLQVGVAVVNNPGLTPGVLHLMYDQPGSPSGVQALAFDKFSICILGSYSSLCTSLNISLDASFHGNEVAVEGKKINGGVLVRRLLLLPENQKTVSWKPGNVFVSWQAVKQLLSECKVTAVFQNHDLTVTLDLADKRKVLSTEPRIDDVVKVAALVGKNCPAFKLGTE